MEALREREPAHVVIALAGNPNSGKTSLFNDITGARQHVGNWPGVTVEKKEGRAVHRGQEVRVVDLPGTYGLGAYSEDERIARDYVLSGEADVIIDVVDAANLERNLYLTVQLLEMGAPVVVALNMVDEARQRGIRVDADKLSRLLGVPVVETVATRNQGVSELLDKALQVAKGAKAPGDSRERVGRGGRIVRYGPEVERELGRLEEMIVGLPALARGYGPRWLALKLLEGDPQITKEVAAQPGTAELLREAESAAQRVSGLVGEDAEAALIDRRYGFIAGLVREVVSRSRTVEQRLSLSDRIDRVVLNRYLGLPILLLAMAGMFQFTFAVSQPLVGWVEAAFAWLGSAVSGALEAAAAPAWLASLLVDGVLGGLGSVLVFLPPIFTLFLAISILEDSGYMARAAYIMDRLMHALGLHGKSFIPMLIGFGCNVPAIMATRTLDNRKDRLVTILINPLMSCSARLPVYVLFAGTFFAARQGLVIFSLYLLGIVLAIVMGRLFKACLFRGETSHFVMELPPYRLPTLRSTLVHMWERGSAFVRKAGTVIVGVVVLVWALSSLPWGVEYASESSLLGRLGNLVAPVLAPAGFGTWEAVAALMFGLLAKEVVVGTLGVVYGTGEEGLADAVRVHFTPLSAYAFMVMALIYVPCVATIAAIRRETNSWGWAAFAVGYSLALGWIMAVLVYQVGRLLGWQ